MMLICFDKGHGLVTAHKINHLITMELSTADNNNVKHTSAALTLQWGLQMLLGVLASAFNI